MKNFFIVLNIFVLKIGYKLQIVNTNIIWPG